MAIANIVGNASGNLTGTGGTLSHAAHASVDGVVVAVATVNTTATISVDYGGVAMTAVTGGNQAASGNDDLRVATFYLANPPTGTQTITVTMSASGAKCIMAISGTGFDTSSLIGDVDGGSGTFQTTSSFGPALTTTSGDLAVCFARLGKDTQATTPNTGDTEFVDADVGADRAYASYEVATGSSTTVGWSSTTQSHATVCLVMKAGSGAQTVVVNPGPDTSSIGSHTLIQDQFIVGNPGVDTSAIGTANVAYDQTVEANAGPDTSAIGSHTLTAEWPIVMDPGVDTSAIGQPTLVPGEVAIVATTGPDTSAVGQPTVTASNTIVANPGVDTSAVGLATILPTNLIVADPGVDTSAIGQPTVAPGTVIVALGAGPDTSAIGQPAVATGNVDIAAQPGPDTSTVGGLAVIIGGEVGADPNVGRSRVALMGI